MRIKNLLLFTLLFLLPAMSFAASDFSYVYIQGDKQTPFYVKLEEGMQPRYGKNYCILSRLSPGPAHIEILFQQNAFPPQQFIIQVPERGSREFMIVRRDGVFNLYDLQQQFYLPAGNKTEDDHAPVIAATRQMPERQAPELPSANRAPRAEAPVSSEPGAWNTGVKKAGEVLSRGRDKSAELARKAVEPLKPKPAQAQESTAAAAGDKPQFIGDMELSTPNSATGGTNTSTRSAAAVPPAAANIPPPMINSDCPNALSTSEFSKVFNGLSAYGTDEERIGYFGKQLDKCYESWQARTLAGKLEGDAARFELLRKIYPRITDQGNFALLDDLLSTPAWKDAFNRLVHR